MTSRREQALLAGLAIAGGYGALLPPKLRRWGATDAEVAAPYPGADLVPGGKRGATMAATIDAPPSRVWPWLVQMGCDRAGWYSWDRLDNGGIPSGRGSTPSGNTSRSAIGWPRHRAATRGSKSPPFSPAAPGATCATEPRPLGPPVLTPPDHGHGSTPTRPGASFSKNCPTDTPDWSSAGTRTPDRNRSQPSPTSCSGSPPTGSCKPVSSRT